MPPAPRFRLPSLAPLPAAIVAVALVSFAGPLQARTDREDPLPSPKVRAQLAQSGSVSPRALMRWCATVPDRFRTAVFERRCAALRRSSRADLREWCNRMPLHWQSARMQRRCSFVVGGDDGSGLDEGGGRNGFGRCNVRRVALIVRSRGCTGQSRRLNFRKPYLRPGETLVGRVETGVIGKGYPPYGACNFRTRLRYQCVRGRLRIVGVYECRQGKSGPTGAQCSLSAW